MKKKLNINDLFYLFSESIISDQAKHLVEEDCLPEEFLQTASDLDDIAQRYKDEIRNQTVSFNPFKI